MTNLNKTYHKGKFRGGEWAKHIRSYLKRVGNKRFRKISVSLEEDDFERFAKSKKKKGRKKIKAKITLRLYGDRKYSYYRSYRSMKALETAVKRSNVIDYSILNKPLE